MIRTENPTRVKMSMKGGKKSMDTKMNKSTKGKGMKKDTGKKGKKASKGSKSGKGGKGSETHPPSLAPQPPPSTKGGKGGGTGTNKPKMGKGNTMNTPGGVVRAWKKKMRADDVKKVNGGGDDGDAVAAESVNVVVEDEYRAQGVDDQYRTDVVEVDDEGIDVRIGGKAQRRRRGQSNVFFQWR
jgi:hypothetical protein